MREHFVTEGRKERWRPCPSGHFGSTGEHDFSPTSLSAPSPFHVSIAPPDALGPGVTFWPIELTARCWERDKTNEAMSASQSECAMHSFQATRATVRSTRSEVDLIKMFQNLVHHQSSRNPTQTPAFSSVLYTRPFPFHKTHIPSQVIPHEHVYGNHAAESKPSKAFPSSCGVVVVGKDCAPRKTS